MDRLIHFFGLALSVVVNILDPDVIVLGGGVGNVGELYTAGYQKLCEYTFHDHPRVQVLKPSLGDSAGVFGAAALAAPEIPFGGLMITQNFRD
jgi:Transcriptional regulator/sugar kinase